MAEKETMEMTGSPEEERKRLKEEKKKLKQEEKERQKEAKKRAKELASQEEELDEMAEGSSGPVFLITLVIVVLWLAVLALLIKLDVGGFGSTVLKPVLENVPYINKILPAEKMPTPMGQDAEAVDEYHGYTDLKTAVDQIRKLELDLENAQTFASQDAKRIEDLQAEITRLKTFEANQIAFEKIKNQFYQEVIYSEKGPGPEEYLKYYQSIDPTLAEQLYREVLTKQQVDSEIQDYANAYSEMKPKAAAAIFEAMQNDLELAAKILDTMDAKSRGNIIGAMDPEVAARLTKIMEPVSGLPHN